MNGGSLLSACDALGARYRAVTFVGSRFTSKTTQSPSGPPAFLYMTYAGLNPQKQKGPSVEALPV